jgi:hypothetical protein
MRLACLVVVVGLAACSKPSSPAGDRTHAAPASKPAPTAAPASVVVRIVIEDHWSGLPAPEDLRVVLAPTPMGWVATDARERWVDGKRVVEADADGRSVPIAEVERLVAVANVAATPQAAFLANATEADWLVAHADAAYARLPIRSPPCRPEAEALFTHAFADPAFARAALAAEYASRHTDDYPKVDVAFEYADGTRRTLASDSQYDAMLPWKTPAGESWNADIAASIAAVLPADAPNRDRLAGGDREARLAAAVQAHLDAATWSNACE